VTGAASGIGAAAVDALTEAGAHCVGVDVVARERCRRLDVTNADDVADLFRAVVAEFGRLDGLVNCAGITGCAPIIDLGEPDLDRILDVNLKGTLYCCQAAVRTMVDTCAAGAIVNLTSAAAYICKPTAGAYSMSKAGVIALTRTLAAEVGSLGIRVNAVAPGFIETPMTTAALTDDPAALEAVFEDRRRRTPLERIGRADEVAATIVYLLTDASSFVTGQVLHANGGMVMTG
jgi:NAD(P)-dependent dehydrogenase (short-subunit alcohol dehydrogenase family)